MRKKNNKAGSVWEKPNKRYYTFLNRIKKGNLPLSLCILGAADGNYVIPAAKMGFEVLAIENDPIVLYGGRATKGSIEFDTAGLIKRIKENGVDKLVTVVDHDYVTYDSKYQFSGVLTSGSVHYQNNSKHSLQKIIESIQNYVAVGGLLLLEYICTSPENNDPKRHFITTKQIASFFQKSNWTVTSNKKKVYIEKPNPRNDKVHRIVWGRLYATKNN